MYVVGAQLSSWRLSVRRTGLQTALPDSAFHKAAADPLPSLTVNAAGSADLGNGSVCLILHPVDQKLLCEFRKQNTFPISDYFRNA